MSRHSDAIRLRHMLDYAREALEFSQGKTRDDVTRDRKLQLALARLVEVIGEAAARVSGEEQARRPSIPWGAIVGIRHKLIHGYDTVDLDILWDTVTRDLPPLVGELEKILPSDQP